MIKSQYSSAIPSQEAVARAHLFLYYVLWEPVQW